MADRCESVTVSDHSRYLPADYPFDRGVEDRVAQAAGVADGLGRGAHVQPAQVPRHRQALAVGADGVLHQMHLGVVCDRQSKDPSVLRHQRTKVV